MVSMRCCRPFSPAWAFGFLFALLKAGQEQFLATAVGARPSSALGLTYVSMLLLLIVFTNIRMRGVNSVMALLTVAFVAVLLAWFGWANEPQAGEMVTDAGAASRRTDGLSADLENRKRSTFWALPSFVAPAATANSW
jgi:hypothetical protein